jgi:hypothetical protein
VLKIYIKPDPIVMGNWVFNPKTMEKKIKVRMERMKRDQYLGIKVPGVLLNKLDSIVLETGVKARADIVIPAIEEYFNKFDK